MRGQKVRILNHLTKYGSITWKEASRLYDVPRLSAVIFELKALGHNIVTERVEEINDYGEKSRIAVYHLIVNQPLENSKKTDE